MSTLAERIREVRHSVGLSQRAFAKQIGVSGAFISCVEAGKREVRDIVLEKIARLCGVDLGWLKSGNQPMILTPRQEAIQKIWMLLDPEIEELLEFLEEQRKRRPVKVEKK